MDIMNHEKEKNLVKFGENLRNLRKEKKLSQEKCPLIDTYT